ncbi:surface antigen like protein, partial [Leishmania braziliensis MHOM/BR/75/M2904]
RLAQSSLTRCTPTLLPSRAPRRRRHRVAALLPLPCPSLPPSCDSLFPPPSPTPKHPREHPVHAHTSLLHQHRTPAVRYTAVSSPTPPTNTPRIRPSPLLLSQR